MRKDSITYLIDKKIIESLEQGVSINDIQFDISEKIEKFKNIVRKNTQIPLETLYLMHYEDKLPTKVKWGVCYILSCYKRINDLGWIKKISHKFPNHTNTQLFELLKLKEKLSFENAVQDAEIINIPI